MICVLAGEPRGCWRAVFEPAILHLYVEFAPSNKADRIRSTISLRAFLATSFTNRRWKD